MIFRNHPPVRGADPQPDQIWDAYLEQGRWLMEQHQRRDTGFQQAAVGLMTLDGVMISVIVAASLQAAVQLTCSERILVIVAAAFLIGSAVLASCVWFPRHIPFANTHETVTHWEAFNRCGRASGQASRPNQLFAHQLLEQQTPTDHTPVIAASHLAEKRARLIKWAVIALQPALIALLVLLVMKVAVQ